MTFLTIGRANFAPANAVVQSGEMQTQAKQVNSANEVKFYILYMYTVLQDGPLLPFCLHALSFFLPFDLSISSSVYSNKYSQPSKWNDSQSSL